MHKTENPASIRKNFSNKNNTLHKLYVFIIDCKKFCSTSDFSLPLFYYISYNTFVLLT